MSSSKENGLYSLRKLYIQHKIEYSSILWESCASVREEACVGVVVAKCEGRDRCGRARWPGVREGRCAGSRASVPTCEGSSVAQDERGKVHEGRCTRERARAFVRECGLAREAVWSKVRAHLCREGSPRGAAKVHWGRHAREHAGVLTCKGVSRSEGARVKKREGTHAGRVGLATEGNGCGCTAANGAADARRHSIAKTPAAPPVSPLLKNGRGSWIRAWRWSMVALIGADADLRAHQLVREGAWHKERGRRVLMLPSETAPTREINCEGSRTASEARAKGCGRRGVGEAVRVTQRKGRGAGEGAQVKQCGRSSAREGRWRRGAGEAARVKQCKGRGAGEGAQVKSRERTRAGVDPQGKMRGANLDAVDFAPPRRSHATRCRPRIPVHPNPELWSFCQADDKEGQGGWAPSPAGGVHSPAAVSSAGSLTASGEVRDEVVRRGEWVVELLDIRKQQRLNRRSAPLPAPPPPPPGLDLSELALLPLPTSPLTAPYARSPSQRPPTSGPRRKSSRRKASSPIRWTAAAGLCRFEAAVRVRTQGSGVRWCCTGTRARAGSSRAYSQSAGGARVHAPGSASDAALDPEAEADMAHMLRVQKRVRAWGVETGALEAGVTGGRGAAVRAVEWLMGDGDEFDAVMDAIGGKEVWEAGGAATCARDEGAVEAVHDDGGRLPRVAGAHRLLSAAGDGKKAGKEKENKKGVKGSTVNYAWMSAAQDVDWEGEDVRDSLRAVVRMTMEERIRPIVVGDTLTFERAGYRGCSRLERRGSAPLRRPAMSWSGTRWRNLVKEGRRYWHCVEVLKLLHSEILGKQDHCMLFDPRVIHSNAREKVLGGSIVEEGGEVVHMRLVLEKTAGENIR
ncbi:hypothetical protein B0H14DRAFT_2619088 [Mycena olivaceomarginata]|nr:hypothetical protein B0H14DRAFT_2619088 [Mycena olivaceomarginata]